MQDERLPKSPEAITQRLASLRSCAMSKLKQQWRTLYDCAPPHRISRELLTRP